MRVVPLIVGEPENGYYVKSVEVSPQTVSVEGLRSTLLKLKSVKTEPIDITGFSESFSQDLKVDYTGRNIRSKVNDVNVKVVIGAKGR